MTGWPIDVLASPLPNPEDPHWSPYMSGPRLCEQHFVCRCCLVSLLTDLTGLPTSLVVVNYIIYT